VYAEELREAGEQLPEPSSAAGYVDG
jgi:hypothetical protein